jgi:transcription antitermination factor NusG
MQSRITISQVAGDLWHIARCFAGKDRSVADRLRDMRYVVYRPVMPVTTLDRRKLLKTDWRSVFPGYLFVQANGQGWSALRRVQGLFENQPLMVRNGSYATIGEDECEIVRALERSLQHRKAKPAGPEYQVGDSVKIKKGPFIDLLAKIERLDPPARLECVLEFFGQLVTARVQMEHVALYGSG